MRALAAVLIVLGIIGLAYGGISYTRHRKVLDLGPIEAHVDEKKTVPLPPVAGAVALLVGVALLTTRRSRMV
jgi:hypothetical protein